MGLLGFLQSVGKIGEAVAVWADPKRREVVKLRLAIEAAENLLQILKNEGIYVSMTKKRQEDYWKHWMKRWNAYKDGV